MASLLRTWPLTHLPALLTLRADGAKPRERRSNGLPTLGDYVATQAGTLPKLALAAYAWAHWCDFEGAARGDAAWLASIVLRDLAITWLVAGVWDALLHASPLGGALRARGLKFNPEEPKKGRFSHDAFWSSVSTVVSSLLEAALMHAWATGALALPAGARPGDRWWAAPASGGFMTWALAAWLLTMPYWRLSHFYFVHRAMHKWWPGRKPGEGWLPDVGAWLYRHVHSLHHRSKNPVAWSGISMHPLESFLYYTAMLVPLAAPALGWAPVHPIVVLYTKFDETIGALVGHDGFDYPGAGSYTHWLHHHYFDCNYSEACVPLDWLFGSHVANEADFEARFAATASPSADGGAKDEGFGESGKGAPAGKTGAARRR